MGLGASQILERHSIITASIHVKLATVLGEVALRFVCVANQLVQRLCRTLATYECGPTL